MTRQISRRRFIGSGLATVGAGIMGVMPKARAFQSHASGGQYPGRGIVVWHPDASEGSQVPLDAAQALIDRGLPALTGDPDPVTALERLLPGVSVQSRIAIKVNTIASPSHCFTRWEVVQALTNRLVEMLGSSYPPSNITIFDQHDLPSHGYTEDRFPGINVSSSNDCSSGVIIPTPGRDSELSRFIAEADFLINMPVLKNHSSNEFTLGMKNHYGSIYPSSWCGDFDGLLAINSFSEIREKTKLVILDGIFGTYVGGLNGGPDNWTLFPGNTPRRLFLGTDPCVVEYLGQQTINDQRAAFNQLDPLVDYYLYRAGAAPYNLGIADPSEMVVEFVDAAAVSASHANPLSADGLSLGVATPNPFRKKTLWLLTCGKTSHYRAAVYDLTGHKIATLHDGRLAAGTHTMIWNGRTDSGSPVGTGSYVLVIDSGASRTSGFATLIR